jgi:transposase
MTKQNKKEVREKIISAYNKQKAVAEIADMFSCHITTVRRIIKRYTTEGITGPKSRNSAGTRKVLVEEHNCAIRAYISENCSITLEQIKERLQRDFGLK